MPALGYRHSDETKHKMRIARLGKVASEETRRKSSESHKGYKQSEETKRKRAQAMLNHITSDETKDKISKALIGHPVSSELREKMRENNIGEKSSRWKGGISKLPGYKHMKWRERYIRKFTANGSHSIDEWEDIKKQYKYTCPSCYRYEPYIKLTEDHIVPLSKGGSDYIDNIQPLCQSCNSRKNVKIIKFSPVPTWPEDKSTWYRP